MAVITQRGEGGGGGGSGSDVERLVKSLVEDAKETLEAAEDEEDTAAGLDRAEGSSKSASVGQLPSGSSDRLEALISVPEQPRARRKESFPVVTELKRACCFPLWSLTLSNTVSWNVAEEDFMTKDAQIEKEETLKKVLSGDLDDSHRDGSQQSALLNELCAQVCTPRPAGPRAASCGIDGHVLEVSFSLSRFRPQMTHSELQRLPYEDVKILFVANATFLLVNIGGQHL